MRVGRRALRVSVRRRESSRHLDTVATHGSKISGSVSRLHPHDVGEPARKIDPGIEPVRIAFYGENPNGDWMLRVIDSAPRDMGSLDAWTLNFWLGAHPE